MAEPDRAAESLRSYAKGWDKLHADIAADMRAGAEAIDLVNRMASIVDAAIRVNAATFSHIDGRDLFAELHPRRSLDIKRRVDGVETWFQGDWLSTIYREIKVLRERIAAVAPNTTSPPSTDP